MIRKTSDDFMIWSYITCSCCGKKQVNDDKRLEEIIAEANDDEHFFDLCDAEAIKNGGGHKEKA